MLNNPSTPDFERLFKTIIDNYDEMFGLYLESNYEGQAVYEYFLENRDKYINQIETGEKPENGNEKNTEENDEKNSETSERSSGI
jgi:hypothetical protein